MGTETMGRVTVAATIENLEDAMPQNVASLVQTNCDGWRSEMRLWIPEQQICRCRLR